MTAKPILILLAEDDLAHAEIVRRNLADCRMANRLVHLTDGQAALDYLHGRPGPGVPAAFGRPNLILLDLRLPKVDGLDVLRALKADEDLRAIPVVVLTTSAAEADRMRAYETGANSYLVKPMDFGQFTGLLRTLGYYWLVWNVYPC